MESVEGQLESVLASEYSPIALVISTVADREARAGEHSSLRIQ